jgi:DNA-binding transcriptional MerR regulator/methylmalonyl-CoA mutase cobalamin-binding subunit
MKSIKSYSIKAVAKETGLTPFVIRAWEKRYQAVVPERTDTNRRVYSSEDVEKLRLLFKATQKGHSIGNIANLSLEDLQEMISINRGDENIIHDDNSKIGTNDLDEQLELCMQAIQELDADKFEKELNNVSINFSQPQILEFIIIPLMEKIGNSWSDGTLRVVNEHMASVIISSFLLNLKDTYKISNNAPKIIFTTPMGQQHEFGALVAGAVAASVGWKVIYLGPNLPSTELIAAVDKLNAKCVGISLVYPPSDPDLKRELSKLKSLSSKVKIFAGGRSAKTYSDILEELNAKITIDLNDFKKELQDLSYE